MTESVLLNDRPVHRIGYGAMQLPGPGVFGPPRDRVSAMNVLRRAVELGVNHIDTAQFYGPDVSNELIRAALHPYPDDLVLVTKVGAVRDDQAAWLPALDPAQLRAAVEDNLRTLDVERLDVVNLRLNEADRSVPLADQIAELSAMHDEGKIGGIGMSNVSVEELDAALGLTEVACVQNAYNLRMRDDQPVLDLCRDRGVPYVPFFPLGSAFAHMPSVSEDPAVRSVASRLGATPNQIALAWLLARWDRILLIPGTSSVAHLEENLSTSTVALDDDALAELG